MSKWPFTGNFHVKNNSRKFFVVHSIRKFFFKVDGYMDEGVCLEGSSV